MVALIDLVIAITTWPGWINAVPDLSMGSYFQPRPSCSGSWHQLDAIPPTESNFINCASFCHQRPNECHGFKFNKTTKLCQLLNMTSVFCPPFSMGLDRMEENIRIASHAFEPLQTVPVISVPTHADGGLFHLETKEPGRNLPLWTHLSLWVKYKGGILGCSSDFNKICQYWDASLADWSAFPSLNKIHAHGVMGTLNGVPYVIGGAEEPFEVPATSLNSQTVEFFNNTSGLWEYGPDLTQRKRLMSLVQFSPSKILVLCGLTYFETLTNVIEMLKTGASAWELLQPYPKAIYSPMVGLIILPNGTQGIMSVGGSVYRGVSGQEEAYFMDSATDTWNRIPEFDFPTGCFIGNTHFYQGTFYLFPERVGTDLINTLLFYKDFESTKWESVDIGLPNDELQTGIFLETQMYTKK